MTLTNFGSVDEDGDESFTEANTCTRLDEDETCTYMGRECVEELSNGQCLVYESRYSCGRTLSYTSPVVKEINICNSDMSCFGGDCLPNTGTDGTMDLADAASKLAAVDMILTDMQCTIDPNGVMRESW
ncbi:conjugal transfer protein TraN [Falsigemmobacter intermedius]|uniref:conjugal transfer protein TraN n=1 Tax=Falsigemmobacter intermedius TaxID=1553448 RepID=UPI003609EC79